MKSKDYTLSMILASSFVQGICLSLLATISQTLMDPQGIALSKSAYGQMFFYLLVGVLLVSSLFPIISRYFTIGKIFCFAALINIIYLLIIFAVVVLHLSGWLTYVMLAIASLMGGVANSMTISNVQYAASKIFPTQVKKITIYIHALVSIGASTGPGWIVLSKAWIGLTSNLLFYAFVAILPLVMYQYLAHRMNLKTSQKNTENTEGSIWGVPLMFLALCTGYGFIEGFAGNWGVTYAESEKFLSRSSAQSCLSLIWLFITVGRLGILVLIKWLSAEFLHALSPVVILIGLSIVLAGKQSLLLFVGFSVLGLGLSYFFPMTVGLSMERFVSLQSKLASYSTGAVMIGYAMGSVGVGVISDVFTISLHRFFQLAMPVAVIVLVTVLFVHGKKIFSHK